MKGSTGAPAGAPASARQLLDMVVYGEQALAAEQPVIDGLNVFPVPDGDTGKNMLATIRYALAQAQGAESLRDAAAQLAQGALLGARGNSGVILSQVFRGLSDSVQRSATLDAPTLRDAFQRAHQLARASVSNPVEGTMLSVLGACAAMAAEADLAAQLATAVVAAEAAVARTPEQLPILAEAQVVDSGGYGLLTMLRGCRGAMGFVPPLLHDNHLLGVDRVRAQVAAGNANPAELVAAPAEPYGLCVTLLVEAPGADELAVRRRLEELGSSVLVVASGSQLKMHLHVPDPSVALDYAATLGTILRSDISDIDEQASGVDAALALPIVAVADGEGLTRLFRSLGASVLAGGPANNPSTADLLAACDEVAACHDRAFLLPNHPNILPGARQAAELRSTLRVVPSAGIPHGIAAALAFEPGAPDDQNLELMTLAAARVCAAELTRAARAATLGGVTVARGELMVMVDGQLLGTGESGLGKLLERAAARQPELATIYYGAAVAEADAEELAIQLRAGLPGLAVEIVRGDQPRAEYLLSFE